MSDTEGYGRVLKVQYLCRTSPGQRGTTIEIQFNWTCTTLIPRKTLSLVGDETHGFNLCNVDLDFYHGRVYYDWRIWVPYTPQLGVFRQRRVWSSFSHTSCKSRKREIIKYFFSCPMTWSLNFDNSYQKIKNKLPFIYGFRKV